MIDLHLHSTASDGALRPRELVRRAKEAGLTAIALTDHDTLAGLPEAREAGIALGLEVIDGVEISLDHRPGTFHMIGLFVDPADPGLRAALSRIRDGRRLRNEALFARLRELRLPLDREEVTSHAGGDVVARPHFARAMVGRGYVRTEKEAFDLWIGKGSPGYVERFRLEAPEAIATIHGAGGVAVLCHPHTLGLAERPLAEFVAGLSEAGLDAMETVYGEANPERESRLGELARRASLLEAGGSDFHGSANHRCPYGRRTLFLPDSWLEPLRERSR